MRSRWRALARAMGFPQVSVSHEVSPLIKLVGRGDTTVVDAYLSPILRRYVDRVAGELGGQSRPSRAASRPPRMGLEEQETLVAPRRPSPSGEGEG